MIQPNSLFAVYLFMLSSHVNECLPLAHLPLTFSSSIFFIRILCLFPRSKNQHHPKPSQLSEEEGYRHGNRAIHQLHFWWNLLFFIIKFIVNKIDTGNKKKHSRYTPVLISNVFVNFFFPYEERNS